MVGNHHFHPFINGCFFLVPGIHTMRVFLFYHIHKPLVMTFHHPFNSPSQPGPARSPRRPHPPVPIWVEFVLRDFFLRKILWCTWNKNRDIYTSNSSVNKKARTKPNSNFQRFESWFFEIVLIFHRFWEFVYWFHGKWIVRPMWITK